MGWIKVVWVDFEDNLIESKGVTTFAEGLGPISGVVAKPGGELYYLDIAGSVYRYFDLTLYLLFTSFK
jgi:hypothetical protein